VKAYNVISDMKCIKIRMFVKIADIARINFRGETLDIRGGNRRTGKSTILQSKDSIS
jgi:hypothetical protein